MKHGKRWLSVLIAVSLLFGFGFDTSKAAAAKKKTVKVKSLSLNYKKKTMTVGSTLKLKASVKPGKAKVKIKWSTSNKKVAIVSSSGKVNAKKNGTATITAAVKGTKLKKTCKITVKKKSTDAANTPAAVNTSNPTVVNTNAPTASPAQTIAYISGKDDVSTVLAAAAADSNITKVTISTDKAEEFVIPEGNYPNLELVIDAPKAEVSNYAVFKKITILQIAADTYREYAKGNSIDANCPVGHIIITDDALAEVNVMKPSAKISVEMNSVVTGSVINVSAQDSTVDISGTTTNKITMNASASSEIKTSRLLQVTATAKITLVLYPGAEDSEVSIDRDALRPDVYGVGSISLSINGEIWTIIAEYRDEVSGEQSIVSLEGSIVDYDTDAALENAKVFLVPYTNSFDESTVESNAYLKQAVTDVDGKYVIDSIRTGNYIMVVKEEGMVTAIQYLVITSRYGDVFQNETLRLFPQTTDNAAGKITGILSNSLDGEPIEGLTARLRKGKGNTTGSVLQKTTSDDSGSYVFEDVDPGYYTVEFVDLRTGQLDGNYISTSMNAVVRSGATDVVSTALTKSVSASQVRFILTWGDESSGAPNDLDSHLTGPKKDSKRRFHTYYRDKIYEEDGIEYADLDYDDTSYEGPETSTIYESVPGIYDFYIHNFTNREDTKSTALATSGAKVEVYRGTILLVTYYVPNNEGTVWHVCSYDSTTGTLTQKNDMSYERDQDMVGVDPEERALISLESALNDLDNILDSLKDNSAKTALQAKYNTYKEYLKKDTHDVEKVQSYADEISELVKKLNDDLYITDITFGDGEDISKSIYNEGALLTIYAADPSDVVIEGIEVAENSTYQIIKTDGQVTSVEVTSSEGYVKQYKVVFSFDENILIPSAIKDASGEDVDWDYDYEWDSDDERKYTIIIYSDSDEGMDFTASSSSKSVNISYGREGGKISKVTFSYGDHSRTYDVRYMIDSYLLGIDTVKSDADNYEDWDYDWDYDENDETYYILIIETEDGQSCDFTAVPRSEKAQVSYEKSDGVIRQVKITLGSSTRVYQVKYQEW